MACLFENVYNSCGCLIGYYLPLKTPAGADITAYPVTALNINEQILGQVGSPSEYAGIWNTDPDNNTKGTLFPGPSAYCFFLTMISGVTPPSVVLGNPIIPDPGLGLITEDGNSPANEQITTEDDIPIFT